MKSMQRPSFKIANLMAAVVVVAALLTFPRYDNALLFNLSLWLIEFVFPYYLIVGIGRTKSAFELSCIAIAMAYLVWGSVFLFRPGNCSGYVPILHLVSMTLTRLVYRTLSPPEGIWVEVYRWNWGLLALVYAAFLTEAVLPRAAANRARARPASRRLRALVSLVPGNAPWLADSGGGVLVARVLATRIRLGECRGRARLVFPGIANRSRPAPGLEDTAGRDQIQAVGT